MDWAAAINNPFLQDLPFKIELDRFGQILMSPATNEHGRWQFRIGREIDRKKNSGEIIVECSIQTTDGVKVADVAWASDGFMAKYGTKTPFPHAPEICVKVISPSNTEAEIAKKIELYLAQGAREVWICHENGSRKYYNAQGPMRLSRETEKT
ncbi:MAG: Uma2 family endonuclease [Gammaproteobacteria bacterium]|nr:Uma2 family endonuclease [Gammaproteobacteria bacterium]NNJ84680.1 Uma2 family endonuclease [Gammaproteobacteria bacterium]